MNVKVVDGSEVEIMGVHMLLLPEAAVYIPARKELLVADLHLGKVEHFRKHGIAVPGAVSMTDIEILRGLICTHKPNRVVFLGDLFHSQHNSSWDDFDAMMLQFQQVEFHLVVGNHDILEDQYYANLHLCDHYSIGNIVCTHEPLDVHIDERYNLCGHIHPAVRLKGKGKQHIRLPCFFLGVETGILPAFGSFTGLHTLRPLQDDLIFVIADQRVARVH